MHNDFFLQPTEQVAQDLLGCTLRIRCAEGWSGGMIVETEAYLHDDPASHSFRGPTRRNRSMFGPPGRIYVYLIYGIHHCLNVVTSREGVGEAVLIRALYSHPGLPFPGHASSTGRRADLLNGPAKLCKALGIDRRHDGLDAFGTDSVISLAGAEGRAAQVECLGPVIRSPRVGITKARELNLRFHLARFSEGLARL